jgi:hypothetical protein
MNKGDTQMSTMTEMDASILSDMHKDAYGFRPGVEFWNRVDLMTDSELQDLRRELQEAVDFELAQDAIRELRAQKSLEEDISGLQTALNTDRTTVLCNLVAANSGETQMDRDIIDFFLFEREIAMQFYPMYRDEILNADG